MTYSIVASESFAFARPDNWRADRSWLPKETFCIESHIQFSLNAKGCCMPVSVYDVLVCKISQLGCSVGCVELWTNPKLEIKNLSIVEFRAFVTCRVYKWALVGVQISNKVITTRSTVNRIFLPSLTTSYQLHETYWEASDLGEVKYNVKRRFVLNDFSHWRQQDWGVNIKFRDYHPEVFISTGKRPSPFGSCNLV